MKCIAMVRQAAGSIPLAESKIALMISLGAFIGVFGGVMGLLHLK